MQKTKVSRVISELMPNVIRGIHLDFFVKSPITQTQFLVLLALRAYKTCSMSDLAKSMGIKMPTATGIVDRLVAGGFVKRYFEENDRRRVLVSIAPKGEIFFKRFQGVIRARWNTVLTALDQRELDSFYRIVSKLLTAIQNQSYEK